MEMFLLYGTHVCLTVWQSAGGCQEVVLARAQDLDRLDDGKIVYSISEGKL